MYLYNSLTRKKEELIGEKIRMYVCGVTVYDRPHLGHALSTVTFDVLHRYLEFIGHEVIRVQNFTDVDDKIIDKARELKISPIEVAEKYIKAFFQDMDQLGVRRADVHPRATEDMSEIIKLIETLVHKNAAYETNGSVYFDINYDKGYGRLSRRKLNEMLENTRTQSEPGKRNPADLALWKAAKPEEIHWQSPWGLGRPGWHIECSAMVKKHLGDEIEIHGGGLDLIFPHHENEITQSQSANDSDLFSKFWVHNGLLKRSGDEKMSKSLGNSYDVRDALDKYSGNCIRLWILQSHYRQPSNLDEDSLENAESSLKRIERILTLKGVDGFDTKDYEERFITAMNDDLGTPSAIAIIFELTHDINKNFSQTKKVNEGINLLYKLGSVLGFDFDISNSFDDKEINKMIELRNKFREEKNYQKADLIRGQLLDKGIEILDSKEGTHYRKI